MKKQIEELAARDMKLIGLALATVLEIDIKVFPAEWETEDNQVPDLQVGTGNNWWLKVNEETRHLYLQSRHNEAENFTHSWDRAGVGRDPMRMWRRLRSLVKSIEEEIGVKIDLQQIPNPQL
jgi:hypothetical protein